MRASCFILADLMVKLLGRDPYHAACTEKWLLILIVVPLVVLAPYLLCKWDAYIRAENARRAAARRRIRERMKRNGEAV